MTATFEHPGDLLSAYLDDELAPDRRAEVDEHVAGCDDCRRELAGIEEARSLVRGLPDVDVPAGYFEGLVAGGVAALEAPRLGRPSQVETRRRTRGVRFGIANIVATAAVWVLVLGIVHADRDHSSVAASDVIAQTASMLPTFGRGAPAPASAAEQAQAAEYHVPSRLAGAYQLAGFTIVDGQPQAVYTDGRRMLTMLAVPGRLDWQSLPQPATVLVNGDPAWEVSTDQADVVLVQRADTVVVLVGPPSDIAPALAGGLDPEVPVDDGLVARLGTASHNLLDTFGLQP